MMISRVTVVERIPPKKPARQSTYLLTLECGHTATRKLSDGPLPRRVNCWETHAASTVGAR